MEKGIIGLIARAIIKARDRKILCKAAALLKEGEIYDRYFILQLGSEEASNLVRLAKEEGYGNGNI